MLFSHFVFSILSCRLYFALCIYKLYAMRKELVGFSRPYMTLIFVDFLRNVNTCGHLLYSFRGKSCTVVALCAVFRPLEEIILRNFFCLHLQL